MKLSNFVENGGQLAVVHDIGDESQSRDQSAHVIHAEGGYLRRRNARPIDRRKSFRFLLTAVAESPTRHSADPSNLIVIQSIQLMMNEWMNEKNQKIQKNFSKIQKKIFFLYFKKFKIFSKIKKKIKMILIQSIQLIMNEWMKEKIQKIQNFKNFQKLIFFYISKNSKFSQKFKKIQNFKNFQNFQKLIFV